MAEIYGRSQAEREILEMCPSGIESFEDIEIRRQDLSNQVKEKKKDFFDMLPDRIEREKIELKKIRNEKTTIQNSDKEIKGFFMNLIYKYVSKPWKLRKIKNSEIKQESVLYELEEKPEDVFEEEQIELYNEIEKLEEIKKNPSYSGAFGELKVLNALRELDENFHVFCDVNVELDGWHWYNGEKNLKSAQMDFVVVSRKGIFVIEVKNWSTKYYDQNENLSPHEQLERAGKVLWIFLKSRFKNVAVKNVLIPVNNNIRYKKEFKFVWVSSISRINDNINDGKDILPNYGVKRIVNVLKKFTTKK